MGVIHTESFQRFGRGIFGFAANSDTMLLAADTEYVTKFALNGTATMTQNGAYNTRSTSQNIGIVQDPITGSKNRLGVNAVDPTLVVADASSMSLERTFATPTTHYIVGFLVRFAAGSVKTASPATAIARSHALSFATLNQAKTGTGTANGISSNIPAAAGHVFTASDVNAATIVSNVGTSMYNTPPSFYMGTAKTKDPNASGKALAYDQDIFVEIEVDTVAQLIKVTIDDVYVGNVTWAAGYSTLNTGFAMWLSTAYSASGSAGALYLSDIYVIDANDSVAPTARLGSTTRVMGEAPDTDVQAQFTRPSGFTSNHDVVDDQITAVAAPANFLSGDTVNQEDRYKTAASNIGSSAGLVYAVNVRTRYNNASATNHEMAAVIKDATNEVNVGYGVTAAGSPIKMSSAIFNKDPSGAAWTPASAATVEYGFKIKS